ncbi:hypothetical protein D6833_03145 [Candidatus Parcubacteria bacterium]|nr:MAG: hypothetical protein D6833_03145 [Candidatus Parcubacteria bacterium]
MPKDKATYTVELDKVMMAFLEEMTTTYHLPDVSKAVRCLVNYARALPEVREAIFAEVRCLDCG